MSTEHEDTTKPAKSAVRDGLSRIESTITKWAVQWLTLQIRKDNGFYIAYQANIAMAFQDEYNRSVKLEDTKIDLHGIANRAANNFMHLWIKR